MTLGLILGSAFIVVQAQAHSTTRRAEPTRQPSAVSFVTPESIPLINAQGERLPSLAPQSRIRVLGVTPSRRWYLVRDQYGNVGYARGHQVRTLRAAATTQAGAVCVNCSTPRVSGSTLDINNLRVSVSSRNQSSRGTTAISPIGARLARLGHRMAACNWRNKSPGQWKKNSSEAAIAACEARPHYRAGGMCYRAVKHIMLAAGVTGNYPNGAYAIQAHTRGTLSNLGFTNKIGQMTPQSAPDGAILVYSGGPQGKGHIEVASRTSSGKRLYCSDYCADRPPGNRRLVGIYIK